MSGISTATSIALGASHSCAVLTGGAIKCWGWNDFRQLGDGTTTQQTTPVVVSGISTATSLALGYMHSCALLTGGAIKCWGRNNYGQLGNGTTTQPTIPVDVSVITTATSLALYSSHSCALLTGGGIKCWGRNNFGQLGNSGTNTDSTTPVDVSGITTATSIALGEEHSCAVLTSGAVKCWGRNAYSQLGNEQLGTLRSTTPVVVDGIPCDASAAPTNGGAGDCTNSLASGSTCQPTCNSGYTVSGSSSCSLGTLTAATCSADSCTASSLSTKDGTDGNFYCINGGTVGGTTGSCTCTSCNAGYGGASCETAGACSTSTDPSKDGADGSFYCINGGTVGGTAGSGSCTCTSCNPGHEGASCQTASACTVSAVSTKDGSDGTFYCINGGTVGGTTGSCT